MNNIIKGIVKQPKITGRLNCIVKRGSSISPIDITENGTYTAGEGLDGYSPINVNVEAVTDEITVTENGTYVPAENVDGFNKVEVNVPNPSEGEINITENGTYDVSMKATAKVNIPSPALIPKTVTANGEYNASDDNADGYSSVSVNVQGGATVHYTQLNDSQSFPRGTYEGIDTLFFDGSAFASNSALIKQVSGIRKIKVHINKGSWANLFEDNIGLEEVEIVNSIDTTKNVTSFAYAFSGCTSLKKIVGEINMSSATAFGQMFRNCAALESLQLTPNSIPKSFGPTGAPMLDDNSLITIANGLKAETTGQTLTLNNATATSPYYRCSTIMGNVVGGLFVADESGTVTLSNYITQTKGWSLAGVT